LLAFKDINPAAPVHLLVIPKKHYATLSACTAEDAPLLGRMLALAPKLAAEFGCGVQHDADGTPAPATRPDQQRS
jgi:histidine triad (HIT) family protein